MYLGLFGILCLSGCYAALKMAQSSSKIDDLDRDSDLHSRMTLVFL